MRPCARAAVAGLAVLSLAGPAQAAGVRDVIGKAKDSARIGGLVAETNLAALLDTLRTSRDSTDQLALVGAVSDIGAAERDSPASVKAYLRANAPPVLLALERGPADWTVRGEAAMALRSLNAAPTDMEQAIAIAQADGSPQAAYMHSRADILRRWQDARGSSAPEGAPDDTGAERRARKVRRARNIGVSYDSLTRAVGESDQAVTAALLDAGVQVGPAAVARAGPAVVSGLAVACSQTPQPDEEVADEMGLLARHGLPLSYADERGNTLLMSAAQFCPWQVADRLLTLGAAPDPVNKQNVTPLQMALVSGKWDVVRVLVEHGARVSREQASQIFFQPPDNESEQSLLARATR